MRCSCGDEATTVHSGVEASAGGGRSLLEIATKLVGPLAVVNYTGVASCLSGIREGPVL